MVKDSSSMSVRGVTVAYRAGVALKDITFDVRPGKITGVFGMKSSGRSTLLRCMAGHFDPTLGSVTYDHAPVRTTKRARRNVAYVGDLVNSYHSESIGRIMVPWKSLRPHWDETLENSVLATFGLKRRTRYSSLDASSKACVHAALGLASGSPVTLFDDVTPAMSAERREQFVEALASAHESSDRSLVVTSQEVDDVADVVDDVIILHQGSLLSCTPAADLTEQFGTLTCDPSRARTIAENCDVIDIIGSPSSPINVVHMPTAIYRSRVSANADLNSVPLEPVTLADAMWHMITLHTRTPQEGE